MKSVTALLLVALLTACGGRADDGDVAEVDGQGEPTYEFTTIEVPGSALTVAAEISDTGDVVGWYREGDVRKGFVLRNGEYTTVEYPGAVVTQLTTIAPDGSVGGAYRMPGEPPVAWHGFVRRPSGEFVEIRHPDHPHSMVQRILANGAIVGCYHNGDFTASMHATTVTNGQLAVRPVPGSMHNGGTPDGRRIVGNFTVEGRGFLAEGDRVTYLEAPGSTATEAWDINQAGTIVGVQVDSAEVTRGYVYRNGRWATLEVPNSVATIALGLNSRGEIVGGWEDSTGRRRGYIAREVRLSGP